MNQKLAVVVLKKGREKPVNNRHPWIFSGSIERFEGELDEHGSVVEIYDSKKHWLARGYFNPSSQIAIRILTWKREEEVDVNFWIRKVQAAIYNRRLLRLEQDERVQADKC